MKKYYFQNPYFGSLTKVLFIFFSIAILAGCGTSKSIENTHNLEHTIEQKFDSVQHTVINQPILDSLILKIAEVKTSKPECDSIAQASLDQVLRQLNSRKKSGENEAGVYYDELHKQIVAYLKLKESTRQLILRNKERKDTTIDKGNSTIPVKYIPKWVMFLAVIGGGTLVFLGYRFSRIWI